ncbi:MAG: radical SAM/SPASM domain-containing protein [Candidatus Binatia bacterium]
MDKALVKAALVAPIRYLGYRRFRTRPLWVTFDVTRNCPSRCLYCTSWGENEKDLTTEQVRHVLRGLKRIGAAYLGLSGGEPLLRRDLVELIRYAKELGFVVGMNTSGMIQSEKLFSDLMDAGLDAMSFSIDGATAETHEKVRKRNPWKRVVEAIKLAVRVRTEKSSRIRISTSTVISRDNVRELGAIARLRQELGADRNNFQPAWEQKPIEGFYSKYGFDTRDQAVLEETRDLLKTLPNGNIPEYYDLLPDFYTNYRKVEAMECFAGRAFVYVDHEGTLFPCNNFMEPLGSLVHDSPEVFLERLEAKETIRKAAAQRCPGCTFVCNMERNVFINSWTRPAKVAAILRKRI